MGVPYKGRHRSHGGPIHATIKRSDPTVCPPRKRDSEWPFSPADPEAPDVVRAAAKRARRGAR